MFSPIFCFRLTSKTPDKVISMGDFVVQNEIEVKPSTTATPGLPCQQMLHRVESQELPKSSSQVLHPTKNTPKQSLEAASSSPIISNRDMNGISGGEVEGDKKGVGVELKRKMKNKTTTQANLTSTSSSASSTSALYTSNPELFPRLAKRLLLGSASMAKEDDRESTLQPHFEPSPIGVQSEDVDAAAAMLVLKHGPRVLSPYHGKKKVFLFFPSQLQ